MEVKEFSFKATLSPEDRAQLVQDVLDALLPHLKTASDSATTTTQETPLGKKEISRFLGCTEQTITKRMAEGKIPFSRMGRRVYFLKSEVLGSMQQPQKRAGR